MRGGRGAQQGITLLVALVLLLALVLLALSVGRSAIFGEKNARAFRDASVAYHSADSALFRLQTMDLMNLSRQELADCNDFLIENFMPPTPGICRGHESNYLILMQKIGAGERILESLNADSDDGLVGSFARWTVVNAETSGMSAARQEQLPTPRYLIEQYEVGGKNMPLNSTLGQPGMKTTSEAYRVTVRGFGPERLLSMPAQNTQEAIYQIPMEN